MAGNDRSTRTTGEIQDRCNALLGMIGGIQELVAVYPRHVDEVPRNAPTEALAAAGEMRLELGRLVDELALRAMAVAP